MSRSFLTVRDDEDSWAAAGFDAGFRATYAPVASSKMGRPKLYGMGRSFSAALPILIDADWLVPGTLEVGI